MPVKAGTCVFFVKVQDEAGGKVQNATIDCTWTLAGSAQPCQSATTNRKGEASLSVAGGSGTYRLTVTDIMKAGQMFDPANSVLTNSTTK